MEYDMYMGMFAHHPHLFNVNSKDLSAESFLGTSGILKHQIHVSWNRSPHVVEREALFEPCGERRHQLHAVMKDFPQRTKSDENNFNIVKKIERFPNHDDEAFVMVDDVSNDIFSALTSLDVASDDWEEISSQITSPSPPAAITHHTFTAPFDTNGVLYYLGTAGYTIPYVNPHDSGMVSASLSSTGRVGSAASKFVQHTASADCNYTLNEPNSWMAVDLGPTRGLIPDYYCLRHDITHANFNALRNWKIQAANVSNLTDTDWVTLQEHVQDVSIAGVALATASWPICLADDLQQPYRHFRILQCGTNSSGQHILTCGGIELYGTLEQAQEETY